MSDFLQRVREKSRSVGLADSTEQTYASWIKRYILFHKFQTELEIGRAPREDIETYIAHLTSVQKLSASSVNQAISALVFLYKEVLRINLPYMSFKRPKKVHALQHPLDANEALTLLSHLPDDLYLMAAIMYGAGIRVTEVCSLRIKDFDFAHHKILVTEAKGNDHRITFLPKSIIPQLKTHLEVVKAQHKRDIQNGHGYTWLPPALRRKYPNAEREWRWQYSFPSQKLSRHRREPENKTLYRFHRSPSTIGSAVKRTANKLGFEKRVTPHILRHSFAVDMRKRGYSVEQIQKLMGHKSDKTTQFHYLRSIEPDIDNLKGPLD